MRYVALLRGINVGGNTMIKMAELKTEFERLGFKNVVTYINSGNLVFDSRKMSEERLASRLETAIEAGFGKAIDVMVREQADIKRVIENNPFAGEYESHKQMHVLFLKAELPREKVELLSEMDFGQERLVIADREIYFYLPLGVADSLFSKKAPLDKKPRVAYTARNWRTVQNLSEL